MSKSKISIWDELNIYDPLRRNKSDLQLMFENIENLKDKFDLLTSVVEKQGMTIKMLDKFIFEKLGLGKVHSLDTE